jgi:N-ethylmaleimide reductase
MSGKPVPAFDYMALKRLFGGLIIVNNNFDRTRANAGIAKGHADMIAFGKPFISNPDLVIRLFLGARLAVANRETFYGGGEEEYTDYHVLRSAEPDACYQDHERVWG